MVFAWIITDDEEEHRAFVAAFRKTFAYDAAMKNPAVVYVDVVPNPFAIREDASISAAAREKIIKAHRKRLNPIRNTCLITQWPNSFDDDGARLDELTDTNQHMVYVLDPAATTGKWRNWASDVMQRRKGETMESFVNGLR